MKNLKTFEDFVNESYDNELLEKKILVPKIINNYFNGDKKGAKALKGWSFKIKDLEFKMKSLDYYGDEPWLQKFLSGEKEQFFDYITLVCGEKEFSVKISSAENKLSVKSNVSKSDNTVLFTIDKKTFGTYIYGQDNPLESLAELLTFLFDKFSKEIYEDFETVVGAKKIFAIKVGAIAPDTGKTPHGWSIYESPNSELYMVRGYYTRFALIGAKGTLKVGEKITLINDQTGKPYFDGGTICEVTEIVKPTREDYIKYSSRNGLDVPVKAFQKQSGKGRLTLYSIK